MLSKLSIKQRMYIIILLILLLFCAMIWFSINLAGNVQDMAIGDTQKIMLEDQKAKLQVAVHSMALSLAKGIETMEDEQAKAAAIRKAVDEIRFETDKSGYYFVYKGTVNVSLPPTKEKQGKDLGGLVDKNGVYPIREMAKQAKAGGGFTQYMWEKPGAGLTPKLGYSQMIKGTQFWIGTGIYLDNIHTFANKMKSGIEKKETSLLIRMLIISGLIFLGITVFCLVIVAGISKGMNAMILSIEDIARGEGDLTKRVDITSKDELGTLADGFNRFIEKLQKIIAQLADETANVETASARLTSISGKMTDSTQQTSSQAGNVSVATEEMSSSLSSVASAMDQSSANANLVASAADEINSTINEIAKNAEKTRGISESAVVKTVDAGKMMEELSKAANSIGQVTETISDISDQTNLLALNATIEAARAGESGKGFAVVANEIKDLAGQTATATLDIKAQIESVQVVSGTTIQSINDVIEVINDAQEMVSGIATAVTEQSSATAEISTNIEQLSQGIQEVNENVSQSAIVANQISEDISRVNSEASKISDNSEQVKDSASHLNEMADKLKTIVQTFIIK